MVAIRSKKALTVEALKKVADLNCPEQHLWFAVMARAILDIGTKKHSESFWENKNLKTYEIILGIRAEYVLRILAEAGIELAGQ
jgi:hypothetical protein